MRWPNVQQLKVGCGGSGSLIARGKGVEVDRRGAMIGIVQLVVRYLLIFLLCAILWRLLYIVRPCLGGMPGWPNPPACSLATLFHRATVPGPPPDLHYLSIALVALLINLSRLLLDLARSMRRKLPSVLAFIILLASISVPCVALAWLLAAVRPCLLDLLETPSYVAMCFALRDQLTDTPPNPLAYGLTALFLAVALAGALWRCDRLRGDVATQ